MSRVNVRPPIVAGQFYPSSSETLRLKIESLIDKNRKKQDIVACVLPHAGYIYSGSVAALAISAFRVKDKAVLIGPNHTGYGVPFSIAEEGTWQTPLGEVEIDSSLALKILKKSKYLESDHLAHKYEHSLEVELPFLQYFKPDLKIVPIALSGERLEVLKDIGSAVASAITESGLKDTTVIIASSDMTHYEPQAQAENKDRVAIDAILSLDEARLIQAIRLKDISMCGYAPVAAMIVAAKALGATRGELIKYQTSGDITGDKDSVVGYAGIIIH